MTAVLKKASDLESLRKVLDPGSIDPSALSMGTLMRELNLRKQPPAILRKLMNALEAQRIARKLGWSRPWNKEGMTLFHALHLDAAENIGLIAKAQELLLPVLTDVPLYSEFVKDLLADPHLMVYLFCHNHRHDGDLHEGLTLGFGRRVPQDSGKRDRIDIVLEDQVHGKGVDGLIDRVRVYVNPWFDHRYDRLFKSQIDMNNASIQPGAGGEGWQSLYDGILQTYGRQKDNPASQFEHWSIRYIDYFGARDHIPQGTRFL